MFYKGKYSRHLVFTAIQYHNVDEFIRSCLGCNEQEFDRRLSNIAREGPHNPYENEFQANIFFGDDRTTKINYTSYSRLCLNLPSYSTRYMGNLQVIYKNCKPDIDDYYDPYDCYHIINTQTGEYVKHNLYQAHYEPDEPITYIKTRPDKVCHSITMVKTNIIKYISFMWMINENYKVTMLCMPDGSLSYKLTNGNLEDHGNINISDSGDLYLDDKKCEDEVLIECILYTIGISI